MAFQTNTTLASNQALINAIAVFAAANGWTVDRNTLTGSTRVVTLHKAGVSDYIHIFNTGTGDVRMRASVGYDGGLAPSAQPNVSPTDCVSNNLVGPYPTVWFFADGDEVNIVVRRADTTGAYSHMAFGVLQKYGAFDGGTFVDGSYFEVTGTSSGQWGTGDHALFGYGATNYGYVRIDADGGTNVWFTLAGNSSISGNNAFTGVGPLSAANMYTGNQRYSTYDISRYINAADDNVFSGRSILQIIELSCNRAGSPLYVSPVGYIDNTRFVSLAKFSPEQELSIADETWMLFPVVRKGSFSSTSGAPNASENNGFAIRKVA